MKTINAITITINAITIKPAAQPDKQFDNLIDIIANEGTLYQAMGNIAKKKGALTTGTELNPRTVDATSRQTITQISNELKKGHSDSSQLKEYIWINQVKTQLQKNNKINCWTYTNKKGEGNYGSNQRT